MNDNVYSAGVKLKMEPFSVLMSIYINENPEFLSESLDSILNNTAYPDEIVMATYSRTRNRIAKISRKNWIISFCDSSKESGPWPCVTSWAFRM